MPFTKEERKLSILANVYIAHGIVVVHQTIDWQRKKTDLVCVLRYDRIKPGSWIAIQGTWPRLWCSQISHCGRMEYLLSVTIVSIPFIELTLSQDWTVCRSLQWRIQEGNFTGGWKIPLSLRAKRAERLAAWGPGARLRAPVGSRGKAPGGGSGGSAPEAPGF